MTLLEPTTTITDFILAFECFFFGHMLFWRHGKISEEVTFKHVRAFALFFLFLGMASLLGGIAHGFNYLKDTNPYFKYIWFFTILSIGKASFYLGSAIVLRFFDNYQKYILPALALKFLIFVFLVFGVIPSDYFVDGDPKFKLAVLDYAPIQLVFFIMMLLTFFKTRSIHHSMIVCGIIFSFVGSFVQILKISPHELFNHNDLYHVIQMVALYFIYKGLVAETVFLKLKFRRI